MESEPAMSRWRRAGYAALSGLTGWLAGQIVCLPVNLMTAARNSEGQSTLFAQTLLYGLLAWGMWTLLLATAAWLLVVLALVGALSLAAMRPSLFHDAAAVSFVHKFAQVIPYGAFAIAFTLVTAWMY